MSRATSPVLRPEEEKYRSEKLPGKGAVNSGLESQGLLTANGQAGGMGIAPDMQDGPDWVMVHQASGRKDLRAYLMLVFGLGFVIAGLAVDPATNCDESGECAPWLVPVAFGMGALFALGGLMGILRNPRRGSRINAVTGELMWWNEIHASASGSLMLADVAVIRVDTKSDTSTVTLLNAQGRSMPFGGTEVITWRLEQWAREVQARFPHIAVEMVA